MSNTNRTELLGALSRIERARTPAQRLEALTLAGEAGHITRDDYFKLLDAPAEKVSAILARIAQRGDSAVGSTSGQVGTGALAGSPVSQAEAQATARRRAGQALVGAYQSLVVPGVPDYYNAGHVARLRDAIGDLTAALDQWVDLHAPTEAP